MSKDFEGWLSSSKLPAIIRHFGTPFHIYDEAGIIKTGEKLKKLFSGVSAEFQEFFAVKANPNLEILKIIKRLGFGFDCSSEPELFLARSVGATANEIMFCSNNTSSGEFEAANKFGGCILNLDDIAMVPKVPIFPETICFRYNPGKRRTGNSIIGNPVEAKYGVTHEQIINAYSMARDRGAKKFGLHTMVCSNQIDYLYVIKTVKMLLKVVNMVSNKLNIKFEFINMGGGIGIPYKPDDKPFNISALAKEAKKLLDQFEKKHGYAPMFFMESGRYITGPHGVLVTKVINTMDKYKKFVGVDVSCISSMMRPAIYYPEGGYHHISVFGKDKGPFETVNIVGSACENSDQFGRDRELPKISEGDIILVHDTGAHCYGMASNYNGRLRPQELMLREDGSVERIRRAERLADYLRTFSFKKLNV
ncbi:diaminopimelate decarboxylase [Patescibacteria group bacterium]|nr:diaminopimelate decarboxylase [Patescibacteria group bacterium]MBU2233645.1 diaminopimelate decarboxylase [Patescibacteria group bacterium]